MGTMLSAISAVTVSTFYHWSAQILMKLIWQLQSFIFYWISCLPVVLVTYILIFIAIFRISFRESRCKTFSTCGSHLTMLTVFYGTLIFMHVQAKFSHSIDTDNVASVFYTLIIPLFDPFIYNLRNKNVNYALYRTLKKIFKYFIWIHIQHKSCNTIAIFHWWSLFIFRGQSFDTP